MSKEHYLNNYKWIVDTCYKEFQFLIDEYGYKHISTELNAHELTIIYRYMDKRGVVIQYEYPGFPTVFFGGEIEVDGKMKVVKYYADKLIEKRCRKNTIAKLLMEGNPKREYGIITDKDAKRIIEYYASALKTYGGDVLKGDYSIFEEHRNRKITAPGRRRSRSGIKKCCSKENSDW